ncbi:uncharacterized protein LOC108682249 [Hyalella azteca]|uniref:Uncharacterized protein LOC108682249 n=2 Tax=Hyalella azteca TaxID=294128 RepID=A0A8B7PL07_HYAAZ|nr:uncharacterized protein LOC108682249 [Hyalella azteca]
MTMTRCWSPWYYYDDVKSGSLACAATTSFFSIFSITYVSYCLDGGDSSQFFLPLFETDVHTTMKSAGGFMIFFYLVYIVSSILMVRGVLNYHRGLMLPWLIQNLLYILAIIAFAIWLQASYYHNLLSVLWCLIWLIFAAVHIYMHRCVRAHYDVIKDMNAADILQIYD